MGLQPSGIVFGESQLKTAYLKGKYGQESMAFEPVTSAIPMQYINVIHHPGGPCWEKHIYS